MFSRLRCHFCGVRSKSSRGTTEFQCQSCEAWNFFDKKGEVADTPARVAAAPRSQPVQLQPSQTFAQPGASSKNFTPQDSNQMFCQTCLTNQRIYTESLANYLPDQEHPQYYEYEQKLPKYKADLERRYPQICKKCAPKVQATISKADRYGLQQNVARNMKDTMARGGRPNKGQRDDWSKWSMRLFLRLLGWALYASLLVQVAWHAYALFMMVFTDKRVDDLDFGHDIDDLAFAPTLTDCAKESLSARFYKPCLGLLNSMMSKALLTSLILLWYNPGLALWYHHTIRVEFVFGQTQYFYIQVMLLFVRTMAWFNLSSWSATQQLTKSQLLGVHGFMIAFMLLLHRYSVRSIHYERWKIQGKMMRGTEEVDVFGAFAGPEKDTSPPQASSIPPLRLFERNTKPFPIESLAPGSTRSKTSSNFPYLPPPSPPDSQSVSDDDMEYQMEWQPSAKLQMPGGPNTATYRPRTSRNSHNYNYGMTQPKGWTPMHAALSGIQSQDAAAEQRRREEAEHARLVEQEMRNRSPFRGQLPPDPMQTRMHGFQPRVQKIEPPISERPGFFDQMSKSFGSQRFGAKPPAKIGTLDRRGGAASTSKKNKNVSFAEGVSMGLNLNDDDEDFSPIKNRKSRSAQQQSSASASGSLNARESNWRLPEKDGATGLEDLFGGGSFRIADEAESVRGSAGAVRSGASWGKILLWGLPVLLLGVGWNVVPVRRAVCMWLVEKLEGMGY